MTMDEKELKRLERGQKLKTNIDELNQQIDCITEVICEEVNITDRTQLLVDYGHVVRISLDKKMTLGVLNHILKKFEEKRDELIKEFERL